MGRAGVALRLCKEPVAWQALGGRHGLCVGGWMRAGVVVEVEEGPPNGPRARAAVGGAGWVGGWAPAAAPKERQEADLA